MSERERERDRDREREARQIDKTGVCLIAIKTSKRFACTASAFRLATVRRFPIVGERTLVQKLVRFGYNSTPRPDAAKALAHMPWL